MNTVIQYILAFSALAIAILYLFKTFVWWPKKSANKTCGSGDCHCH